MQIQRNNRDGTLKGFEPLGSYETPQLLIAAIVEFAASEPGYNVIAGERLDENSTKRVANIVATPEGLIWQNVIDL